MMNTNSLEVNGLIACDKHNWSAGPSKHEFGSAVDYCPFCMQEELKQEKVISRTLQQHLQLRDEKINRLIKRLVAIQSLKCADDIVLPDGRRFTFNPPNDIVRDAWKGLTQAINDIELS